MKGERQKVVLCLEDTESRIRWLREIATSYGATVHSTAIVDDFIALCHWHTRSEVKAIVLDHDLGGYLMPVSLQDPNGHDGVNAVEDMPLFTTVPVLVWSSNDEESPRMQQLLRDRGFAEVERQPWHGDRDEIRKTLQGWLSRAG